MSTSFPAIPARENMERGNGSQPLLYLNRFYGGRDGVCSQITVGDKYVQLDAEGIAKLREGLDTLFPPTTTPGDPLDAIDDLLLETGRGLARAKDAGPVADKIGLDVGPRIRLSALSDAKVAVAAALRRAKAGG